MPRRKIPDDFYDRIRPRLLERIGRDLRLAYRVLDIGCGRCGLGEFLNARYHQRVTGVDTAGGKLPKPRRRRKHQGTLRCIRADASKLGFLKRASLDAAVSMWSLHEMARPLQVLRQVRRKLRPGGKLLIVDFPSRSLAQRRWNENYYTLTELKALLIKAGFEEVRVRMQERRQVLWATGWCPARS